VVTVEETALIMVVDDNVSISKTMSYVLKQKGHEVLIANNGNEAIDIIKLNKNIEIVFMDIKMPLMNGVETYKKIKHIIPDAAVIMMTAYSVEDLIQEALEEGAYGVVYKPLDFNNITSLIKKSLASNEGALVLVVDDDPSTRETFKKALAHNGYNVSVVETGEEAIELTKTEDFDIIFIDMKLPTINGLETYLKIKEYRPNAVAIIVTGFAQELSELVDEALLTSCYSCLTKPLDMAQVFEIICEVKVRKQEVV
jgi:two-component system response regulator HydG